MLGSPSSPLDFALAWQHSSGASMRVCFAASGHAAPDKGDASLAACASLISRCLTWRRVQDGTHRLSAQCLLQRTLSLLSRQSSS